MLQSSTPLRKHINNFLKHVHPDLFHEDIEFERVNLDSLQKLHCFIDEVKQFENGASHGAVRLLVPGSRSPALLSDSASPRAQVLREA